MMSKEDSKRMYLQMIKGQWDPNRTHDFLGKGLLTTRPTKNINHHVITIAFFTICWMWLVILRLICFCIMRLSRWNSLGKTEFVPSDNNPKRSESKIITKKLPYALYRLQWFLSQENYSVCSNKSLVFLCTQATSQISSSVVSYGADMKWENCTPTPQV